MSTEVLHGKPIRVKVDIEVEAGMTEGRNRVKRYLWKETAVATPQAAGADIESDEIPF
jgi:hypothetical protein